MTKDDFKGAAHEDSSTAEDFYLRMLKRNATEFITFTSAFFIFLVTCSHNMDDVVIKMLCTMGGVLSALKAVQSVTDAHENSEKATIGSIKRLEKEIAALDEQIAENDYVISS